MRPVILRMPRARTCAASEATSPLENVGSPEPTRKRSPFQVGPARVPTPTTVVAKRKFGRSVLSAPTVV